MTSTTFTYCLLIACFLLSTTVTAAALVVPSLFTPLSSSSRRRYYQTHRLSLIQQQHHQNLHDEAIQEYIQTNDNNRRRSIILTTTAALVTLALNPQQSQALQERNEALCGTGFFEHIYEYKCTAIGDIEDEGMSKKMDESMEISADSLMGKLGAEFEFSNDDEYSRRGKRQKETIIRNKSNEKQEE